MMMDQMRAGAGANEASTFITGLAAKKAKSASKSHRRSDVSVTDSEMNDGDL